MGLQLPLARRRQDARDHSHHRDRAGRSQRADGSSRRDARQGLSAEGRQSRRRPAPGRRGRAGGRDPAADVEREGGRVRRLSVARGASQRRPERGDGRPARLRRRQSGRGPRGRRDAPCSASRARRPRNDAYRHGPAMGPAERLAAAAISGDQGSERLWRTGARARDRPALDRDQRARLRGLGRPGREVRRRSRSRRGAGGRARRRIRAAGRLRLDQWRARRADGRISRPRRQGARDSRLSLNPRRSPDG